MKRNQTKPKNGALNNQLRIFWPGILWAQADRKDKGGDEVEDYLMTTENVANAGGDGQNQNVDAGSGNQNNAGNDNLKAELLAELSGQITGAVKRILAQEKKTAPQSGEVDLTQEFNIDGEAVTLAELVKNRQDLQAERLEKAKQERYIKTVEELTNRGVFEPKIVAKALLSETETVDINAFCQQYPHLIRSKTSHGGGGGEGVGYRTELKNKRTSEAELNNLAAGSFLR